MSYFLISFGLFEIEGLELQPRFIASYKDENEAFDHALDFAVRMYEDNAEANGLPTYADVLEANEITEEEEEEYGDGIALYSEEKLNWIEYDVEEVVKGKDDNWYYSNTGDPIDSIVLDYIEIFE